jgi:hypothetical protein
MKRAAVFFSIAALSIGLFVQSAFAVAAVPASSVWFDPTTGAAGTATTLHALVYNNQVVDATVTVTFTSPAGKIGEVSDTVPKQTAKTLSLAWKLPEKSTVVTAAVSAAIDKGKKPLPKLVGVLGTVTVSSTDTSAIAGVSFPGSSKLKAWFTPLLVKTEAFRVKESKYFDELQLRTRKELGIGAKDSMTKGMTVAAVTSHPAQYGTLVYAVALSSLFGSAAVFYIACALLILLIVRFIVNLFF